MADNEHGYFWNSNEGDRIYDADSFSNWLRKFFTTGVFQNDLQVTADGGMVVRVGTGYANIEGKVRMFDAETTFTIAASNSRYPRIDTIVVQKSENARSITLEYVQGGANATPSPVPPTRSGGIYQLVLAQVYVAAGATSITQANITDKRPDSSVCGWVTGTVDEIDIQQIMAQSQTQFNEWFANIQDILDEDTAGHLQNEIEAADANIQTLVDKTLITVVTEANTDLDNYTTQGVYYFEGAYVPTNIPVGTNGYLFVFPSGNDLFVKQIWSRSGTAGANDNMTYIREYSAIQERWGGWTEFVTERRLQDLAHIRTYATTGEGSGIIFEGGGTTIIGAGECAQKIVDNNVNNAKVGTNESVHIAGDDAVYLYSACQNIDNRKTVRLTSAGNLDVLNGGINASGAIKSNGKTCFPITYKDVDFYPHTATWATATGIYYSEMNVTGWQWIYGITINGGWGGLPALVVPYVVNAGRIGFMSTVNSFPSSNAKVSVRIIGTRTSGD